MRYLLNVTETYGVEDQAEVDALKEELLADSSFELVAFGSKKKEIKVKREVVGEYQLVTAKKVYLNEKEIYQA